MTYNNILIIQPLVKERMCGGWLAVCPAGAAVHFGVTAKTREGVVKAFNIAAKRWSDALLNETKPPEGGHTGL